MRYIWEYRITLLLCIDNDKIYTQKYSRSIYKSIKLKIQQCEISILCIIRNLYRSIPITLSRRRKISKT